MAQIKSLDLLVHPFHSALFESRPYFDSASGIFVYEELRHMNPDIDLQCYVELLVFQWGERIREVSKKTTTAAVLLKCYSNDSCELERELIAIGKSGLGNRFKVLDGTREVLDICSVIENYLSSLSPKRRKPGEITTYAYGEISNHCVSHFSNQLNLHLSYSGWKSSREIVWDLCGDLSDGKAEAYRRFLDSKQRSKK